MENTTTAVATQVIKRPIAVSDRGIVIDSMDTLWRFSQYVSISGLAPKGMEKPESIFVAVQLGLEVGLPPMAALQSIAVINGRPTIWGDSCLGIVRSSSELEEFSEWYEVDGKKTARNPTTFTDDVSAVCRVKRRGFEVQECAFSVADAKRAGLWDKVGPWKQYPARMLKFRARGFVLRDNFGDVLKGMASTEEAMDTKVIDVDSSSVSETPQPQQLKRGATAQIELPKTRKPKEKPQEPPATEQNAPVTASEPPPEQVASPSENAKENVESAAPVQSGVSRDFQNSILNAGHDFDSVKEVCEDRVQLSPRAVMWTGFQDISDADIIYIVENLRVTPESMVWKTVRNVAKPPTQ